MFWNMRAETEVTGLLRRMTMPKLHRLGLRDLKAVCRMMDRWIERSSQRRILAELDDRRLVDLGLSRSQVSREVDKPFWRWRPQIDSRP